MTDSNREKKSQKKTSDRKGWDDLLFSTIEKIAATPGKLKDPKESIVTAVDWMKGLREEVVDKIKDEVANRLGKIDWNLLSEKLGDHLAENYRLKIDAKIEWEPKEKKASMAAAPVSEDPE
ncbi:MAG: hypothetical protein COV44_01905 [Deltaproteobacteria bacterium CG11_big_fil_rev_8_21_14_0_20_45_16]|nr:MAG: hypothetical protein COV44_01905 [Deltaproteobacteria bacterium CG11_big_fil_rev_8_21_14_0_20_45_16]